MKIEDILIAGKILGSGGSGGGGGDMEAFIDGSITELTSYATTIRDNALKGQSLRIPYNFPNATRIGIGAFESNYLTKINAPEAVEVGVKGFHTGLYLEEISLPKATTIGNQAFAGCSRLTSISLPLARTIPQYLLQSCSSLTFVDSGAATTIQQTAFYSTKLSTLILRSTAVVTLANSNAFNGTPFASGGTGGTLYVPQSLISSYQNATNWSAILGYANNQILPIEGSEYE